MVSIEKSLNKIKPNMIINAAAFTKVDEAEIKKKKCYKINVLSTKKIADWCYKNNCFLVHYSTVYIFDGKNNKDWKENNKPKPINFYGKSKLEAEKKIFSSKCNYLILRLNWIYSDYGNNFPSKIIKKIKKEKNLSIVNDQFGTPNHAEFISNISIKILQKIINSKINPKILNISARGKTNYYKLTEKILNKLGSAFQSCNLIPIDSYTYRKLGKNTPIVKRPSNSLLNLRKLENFLNVKMPYWDQIFEKKIKKLIKNTLKNY